MGRLRPGQFWPALLLLAIVILGLTRLRFDVEVLNLLPAQLHAVQGLRQYQENFANARELILTVRGRDAATTEGLTRSLALSLREAGGVAAVTWQPPWQERPAEGAELSAYLWFQQPPDVFGQLIHRLDPLTLPSALDDAQQQLAMSFSPGEIGRLAYDPLNLLELPESATVESLGTGDAERYFVSPDGTFRVVFVKADNDLSSYRECVRWLESIQRHVAFWRESESERSPLEIAFTGRPAFVAEIGGGMERDIIRSIAGTGLIIACLFWWTHRRWRPLLWLLALLLMILGGTLALGGLMLGTLNVVSTGFAAILLGLAADYGLVLYQEARARRHPDAAALRRELTPTIAWAALTTAGAFALLNLSSLPGLAQLGSLVAIGVLLAAFVMLAAYLPPLLKQSPAGANTASSPARNWIPNPRLVRIATGVVFAGMAIVLFMGLPQFDRSPDALRPGRSAAYAALDDIRDELRTGPEPFWLVMRGSDAHDVRNLLDRARPVLEHSKASGEIEDFTLPDSLWPDPRLQEANRDTARVLAGRREAVRAAFLDSGFTTNALVMTGTMLDFWDRAATETPPIWPANPSSQWVLDKFAARAPGSLLALGLVYAPADSADARDSSAFDALIADLPRDGVWLSGWDHLGSELSGLVLRELPVVLGWIGLLVCGALWLVFRKPREVFLSLATLLLSVGVLMAVMRAAAWSWNMMNLMAVPLLFGLGVDYSIHIQLALRRHHGDLAAVRQSVGRALLLAGGTTITAFGSLAFSSNAGLASLGRVCAAGITATMLIAVFLLPGWWRAWARTDDTVEQSP